MDDLDVLARDFGYRPQGKSAPMKSEPTNRRPSAVRSSSPMFNDVFGGSPKFTNPSNKHPNDDYDSIFNKNNNNYNKSNVNSRNSNDSKTSSLPVYDKPVYDDDIFEGLPGLKSKSVSRMKFEDNVFASPTKQNTRINHQFDDLLGNLGNGANKGKNMRSSSARGFDDLLGNYGRNDKVAEPKSSGRSSSSRGIDDLLGGFGSGSPASARTTPKSHRPPKSTTAMDDPFVVLESTSTPTSSSSGVFTDPLDEISNLGKSGSGGTFDDLDPLHGFGKSAPPFSSEKFGKEDRNPSRMGPRTQTSSGRDHSKSSFSQNDFSPGFASANLKEKNFQADIPLNFGQAKSDDIWLSVSEVPLVTQPTKAPPPSRPPPPIPRRTSKADGGFFSPNFRKKGDGYSPSYSSHTERLQPARPEGRSHPASQIDELEDFVMGRAENTVEEIANTQSSKQMDGVSAAMKEAMDRAEARFKHAKEVREREHTKAAKSTETVQMEKDEHVNNREREFKDNEVRLQRERRQREKEEEERKQMRLEKERERARQAEIERQAVERATREARERAVAEARARAERSAAEKAQAEARERAERSAVHRAQAEARGRAAAEARERAEKAAAEAKERANVEAREKEAQGKAEARRRAERAAAEARERAATEARERDAAAARMNQQRNENDLESFFSTRPSSVPKARDPVFDSQFQSKGGPDSAKRTSSTTESSPNIKKTSSTSNLVDDLSSIFGAPPSSGEFQEVEGESEERRRARLERHQRTQERAAKALAEKNQRDLQAQRDQEERHKISETLDFEIKRWAAGKEGNLRALLSTLQYVLWPECGWQPVSLTDLITGASVKKMYRKATLCIHPDKVQQKGANLQQKYIAEKVFDLLKEAWNKFNSEELF